MPVYKVLLSWYRYARKLATCYYTRSPYCCCVATIVHTGDQLPDPRLASRALISREARVSHFAPRETTLYPNPVPTEPTQPTRSPEREQTIMKAPPTTLSAASAISYCATSPAASAAHARSRAVTFAAPASAVPAVTKSQCRTHK